ncbi:CGNR zinc finger domain-containing protein [Actinosynnema sp. NPDC004786]
MGTDAPLLGEPLPVELMNTLFADRDGVHDALRDRDGVTAWLHAVHHRTDHPSAPGEPTAADHDRLVALRDALRRLAAEVTEDPRPAAADPHGLHAAVSVLNETAADTPRWSALSWTPEPSRHTRTAGRAVAAVVSAIAEDAIALFGGDGRHRLRACLGPGCVLYFLKDHPRREWCSAGCGNRARSARHYRRHRGTTT